MQIHEMEIIQNRPIERTWLPWDCQTLAELLDTKDPDVIAHAILSEHRIGTGDEKVRVVAIRSVIGALLGFTLWPR